MSVLGFIFLVIFCIWIVLSPIVWLYWHFRTEFYPNNKISTIVGLGAILGITLLFSFGFDSALFFIPSLSDDLHYDITSESLGVFFGFWCAMIFLAITDKYRRLRIENENLKQLLDKKYDIENSEHRK